MASVKFYLDTRRLKADGTAPLKLTVSHANSTKHLPLDLSIDPAHWDTHTRTLAPTHPHFARLDLNLRRIRIAVDELLLSGQFGSVDQIIDGINERLFPERRTVMKAKPMLVQAAERFLATKSTASTIDSYRCMLKHVERFCGDVPLDDINREWLLNFEAHMAQTAKSPNGRAVYFRNLRAVVNYAIDCEMTANYPFRRYRIKTIKTAKRSLTAGQLRQLLTMEVEDWQRPYRDFFALSFYLIGTNSKDLLMLPPGADATGRIEFNRAKTGKLYSIKVEPEAAEIISRYRGRRHMIDVLDTRTYYKQYVAYCNHALQSIGSGARQGRKADAAPLFPGLTTYWARHSWATMAAEIDIPRDTISAALGHDMGNSTTAIYINYNLAKVDDANRRVIDFVLRGIR